MSNVKYTLEDVGCYVDGARGIYATDAIQEFAEAHGMEQIECKGHKHAETCFSSRFAGCEFAGEIEDEADFYMNENYGVEGCYWGRSEGGDWGLWPIEEDPFASKYRNYGVDGTYWGRNENGDWGLWQSEED
jgi:hypothetical protein